MESRKISRLVAGIASLYPSDTDSIWGRDSRKTYHALGKTTCDSKDPCPFGPFATVQSMILLHSPDPEIEPNSSELVVPTSAYKPRGSHPQLLLLWQVLFTPNPYRLWIGDRDRANCSSIEQQRSCCSKDNHPTQLDPSLSLTPAHVSSSQSSPTQTLLPLDINLSTFTSLYHVDYGLLFTFHCLIS